MSGMAQSKNKQKGNGLGENNAKSWNPGSVGDYKRGLNSFVKGIAGHFRKGAGAKQ